MALSFVNPFFPLFHNLSFNVSAEAVLIFSRYSINRNFPCFFEFMLLKYLGQSIQESTKSSLWKAAFKKFEGVWSALA